MQAIQREIDEYSQLDSHIPFVSAMLLKYVAALEIAREEARLQWHLVFLPEGVDIEWATEKDRLTAAIREAMAKLYEALES